MAQSKERKLRICVITPYLQGDYMGEILENIRFLCESRGCLFTAIRTDSFGEFSLGLGLSDYDGVIVIRNAASPKLIEAIQSRKIPVVAIAHDYFPLSVPIASCDNKLGMDLAFNYLLARGHEKLVFIGDVTQYDLRKRYERFCDLHTEHQMNCIDEQFIQVSEALFSGGFAGGSEFLKLGRRYTGVICGAGYTAMGFVKRMDEAGVKIPRDIEVVGFDDIPMMRVLTPKMPRVDQNLNLLAEKSMELLEKLISNEEVSDTAISIAPTLVEPNLDAQGNVPARGADFYAKSVGHPEYARSLIHGNFELTHNIVRSELDHIMSIAPFFEQFMEVGCLTKLVQDKFDRTRLRHVKIFTHTAALHIDEDDDDYLFALETFPGRHFKQEYGRDKDTCVHFPVICQKKLWGFLSMFGKSSKDNSYSSFTGFTGYLDTIVFHYSQTLEIERLRAGLVERTPHPVDSEEKVNHYPGFEWDLEKGRIRWNRYALELLGFVTDLERSIYRNMEIFDRVHDDDEQNLRKQLTTSLSNLKTMKVDVRLKNAEGVFQKFHLEGETIREKDKKAIQYRCRISLLG